MNEDITDCERLRVHQGALFEYDARGRLQSCRASVSLPVPRLHLARSRQGTVWRMRSDLRPELVRQISRLAGRESSLSEGPPPWPHPERLEALRRVLGNDEESRPILFAALFNLESIPPLRLRAFGADSRGLGSGAGQSGESHQLEWVRRLGDISSRMPCRVVVEEHRVVSVCYSASGDLRSGVEAGVMTLPSHQGRGLAARCLAGWSLDVLEAGGRPLFSAHWDDSARLALAGQLDLVPYGDAFYFT